MAFSKFLYNLIGWKNKSESLTTPLGASNLNKMDSAIKTIGDNLNTAYDELSEGKLNKDTANTMISNVSYTESTGIFTVTRLNGSSFTIDTKLEKIVTNWDYDEDTQKLILTLEDGTTKDIDLSALITQYEFIDSDTIAFTIESNGTVTANVKDGSITEDKLQPNYLAEVKSNASNAETSAQNASNYADDASYDAKLAQSYAVGGSGIREGEDADNAKYHAQRAKEEADKIIEIAGGDFVLQSEKGEANGVAPLDANALIPLEYVPDNPLLKDNASKNLLEVTATSQTINGVTFTVNEDGSVTASGTASANAIFYANKSVFLDTGTYTLSGCPSGGGGSTYRIDTYTGTNPSVNDTGKGASIVSVGGTYIIRIIVMSGQTVSNLTFYPMIRKAEITDDTYEPHYATNKELTKIVNEGSVNSADKLATPRKINGVDFDGSKDITVSDRKYCIVGNNSNSGWYKFASGTLSNNDNINVMFGLTSNYIQYFSGILVFQARCENSALTVYKLSWHTRIGFNADDVMCVVDGMSYTLYVKLRTSQYGRIMIERLMESTRAIADASAYITLHNNDVVESTEPVATLTSSDGATVLRAIHDGAGNKIDETYLPLTGGTMTGDLRVGNSNSEALRELRVTNAKRNVDLQVNASGVCYLWDLTNKKAILSSEADGTNKFLGNADTATKAEQDGNGKVIADTYATLSNLNSASQNLNNSINRLDLNKASIQTKAITSTGSASFTVKVGSIIFITAGPANSSGNHLVIAQVRAEGVLSDIYKSSASIAISLSLSALTLSVGIGSSNGATITVLS